MRADESGFTIRDHERVQLFITDSQLEAITSYCAQFDTSEEVDSMCSDEHGPPSRMYHCACEGKKYTSKQYREWNELMKVEKTGYKQEHGDKVPLDYPDGWAAGWCHECSQMLSVVDLTGKGI